MYFVDSVDENAEENVESKHDVEFDLPPTSTDNSSTDFVRVCLLCVVEPVRVEIVPEFINLGKIEINSCVAFTLNMTNKHSRLPIYYGIDKTAFLRVDPEFGLLNSGQSVVLNMKLKPCGPITNTIYVKINFLYPQQPSACSPNYIAKELELVSQTKIPIYVTIVMKPQSKIIKFNMGITPMITNEVGILTNDVRFCDKVPKPRQAVIGLPEEEYKHETALMAFPNDRPHSLRKTKNEIV